MAPPRTIHDREAIACDKRSDKDDGSRCFAFFLFALAVVTIVWWIHVIRKYDAIAKNGGGLQAKGGKLKGFVIAGGQGLPASPFRTDDGDK